MVGLPVGTHAFGIQGAVFCDVLGWATLLNLFKSLGSTGGPSGGKNLAIFRSGSADSSHLPCGMRMEGSPKVREAMRGPREPLNATNRKMFTPWIDSQSSGKG